MLTAARVHEIESIAESRLRLVFGDNPLDIRLPVDVFAVAAAEGLQIVEAQFADHGVSGSFDGVVIRIARRDELQRKAFTVAHEVGHSVLHAGDLNGRVEVLFRRDLDDPMAAQGQAEAEANVFAASLLMPRTVLRAFEGKGMGVSEMAEAFGVSTRTIEYRQLRLEEYLGSL